MTYGYPNVKWLVLALQGNRVCVAVSWNASASATYHYGILTDLNLVVKKPDGAVNAVSKSLYNTYEMVDFIASQTGLYRFEVTKSDEAIHEKRSQCIALL